MKLSLDDHKKEDPGGLSVSDVTGDLVLSATLDNFLEKKKFCGCCSHQRRQRMSKLDNSDSFLCLFSLKFAESIQLATFSTEQPRIISHQPVTR